MNVLVTGGAGYIGSVTARALLDAGHAVTVVDDLSTGYEDNVPAGAVFVRADVRDRRLVHVLRGVDAVIHFAARVQVGESVVEPRLYYRDNLVAGVTFLESVLDAGVRRFVLSSTAAVYGAPRILPIPEEHPTAPSNPYGVSKLALEGVLADYGRAYGLEWTALRYFNAAGAWGGLRERHAPETHLIPLAIEAARGGRPLRIFGDDYPTSDGTCVRDYVHVHDLARAHVIALTRRASGPLNLGTGRGHTVREVVAAIERVGGRPVPVEVAPRRPGDPPALVADPERARSELGWDPDRSQLEHIVADAWHSA